MARSFSQILAEVSAKSDPQRKIVLGQISALPTQQKAEEASLAAKKDQAFEDILGGARQRGLGFSGIPLGEQAKYASTEYAPALANLKTGYGNQKATLQSALADIGKQNYSTAYDIFNQDRAFREQQRQFNQNLAFQKAQAAAERRASAAASAMPTLGSVGNTAPSAPSIPVNPTTQALYNSVRGFLSKDYNRVNRELNAIIKSAGFGNKNDRLKLQMIYQLRPDLMSKQALKIAGIK